MTPSQQRLCNEISHVLSSNAGVTEKLNQVRVIVDRTEKPKARWVPLVSIVDGAEVLFRVEDEFFEGIYIRTQANFGGAGIRVKVHHSVLEYTVSPSDVWVRP